jgi:glycosyltransferase involved in cell wall biosynthesis
MPRPLRITVVTPSLNQATFLPRTLDSVLGQRGAFELDYRVQDGGSRDGSIEVLERYADRLQFKVEPDRGQADAVNRAFRHADGDVVGWVNSDDLLLPGALDRVASVFRERSETVWVHGRCEIIDEQNRPIRPWLSAYKDWRCRRYSYQKLLLENFVSQMTVFWRRDAIDATPLDETLHYALDYDLWLRLGKRSDPVFIDAPQAAFRWYDTSKSGALFDRQFEEDLRVFERHAPQSDHLLCLEKRLHTAGILAAYRLLKSFR